MCTHVYDPTELILRRFNWRINCALRRVVIAVVSVRVIKLITITPTDCKQTIAELSGCAETDPIRRSLYAIRTAQTCLCVCVSIYYLRNLFFFVDTFFGHYLRCAFIFSLVAYRVTCVTDFWFANCLTHTRTHQTQQDWRWTHIVDSVRNMYQKRETNLESLF